MPLHKKDDVRNALSDDLFASGDMSRSIPKYRVPDQE